MAEKSLEDVIRSACGVGSEGIRINYAPDESWGPWYVTVEHGGMSNFDEGSGESLIEAIRNAIAVAQEGR